MKAGWLKSHNSHNVSFSNPGVIKELYDVLHGSSFLKKMGGLKGECHQQILNESEGCYHEV